MTGRLCSGARGAYPQRSVPLAPERRTPAIRPNPLGGSLFRRRTAIATRVQTALGMHPCRNRAPASEIGCRAATWGSAKASGCTTHAPRFTSRTPNQKHGSREARGSGDAQPARLSSTDGQSKTVRNADRGVTGETYTGLLSAQAAMMARGACQFRRLLFTRFFFSGVPPPPLCQWSNDGEAPYVSPKPPLHRDKPGGGVSKRVSSVFRQGGIPPELTCARASTFPLLLPRNTLF